jgi:hypothetical protein
VLSGGEAHDGYQPFFLAFELSLFHESGDKLQGLDHVMVENVDIIELTS